MSAVCYELMETLARPGALEVLGTLDRAYAFDEDRQIYKSTCPFCDSQLWIRGSLFACENRYCSWLSGSVVDFVAAFKNPSTPDYTQAIRWLSRLFRSQYRDVQAIIDDPRQLQQTVNSFRLSRKLFTTLLHMAGPGAKLSAEMTAANAWKQAHGVDVETSDVTLFPGDERLIDALSSILDAADVSHDLRSLSAPCLVVPYGISGSWFTSIFAVELNSKPKSATVFLDDQALQFSGLLQVMPWMRASCAQHFVRAAQVASRCARTQPDTTCLSVFPRRGVSWKRVLRGLPVQTYLVDDHEIPFAGSFLRDHLPGLTFANLEEFPLGNTVSWLEMIRKRLQLDKTRGLVGKSADIIKNAGLHDNEIDTLRAQLLAEGYTVAANQLDVLNTERIVLQHNKTFLAKTADGYELREPKRPASLVTNFTADPTSNIIYDESDDVGIVFRVAFGGKKLEAVIQRSDLDNPNTVELAIQRETGGMQVDGTTHIPSVFSKTGYRFVARHWREAGAKLPGKHGIRRFGWSLDRRRFHTLNGVMSSDGWVERDNFLARNVPSRIFDKTKVTQPSSLFRISEAPSGIRDIACLVAAFVARSYLNRNIRAAVIQDDPRVQQAVEAIWMAAFGQVMPVPEIQSVSEFTFGLPVFGFAGSRALATEMTHASILLTPGGYQLSLPGKDDDFQSWGSCVLSVAREVSAHMLAWVDEYPVFPHVLTISSYIDEGAWLLSKCAGLKLKPTIKPFRALESVLQELPTDKVAQRVRYDAGAQLIHLDCGAADVADDTEMELRGLIPDLRRSGSTLKADVGVVSQLLMNYYSGRLPELSRI